MSAETLRRAASLMRERAEVVVENVDEWYEADEVLAILRRGDINNSAQPYDAEHIASWHPAVALAVAALLDRHAEIHEYLSPLGLDQPVDPWTLAVARAYLGEQS